MKKKNIFLGIGSVIVMAMALNFNVSQSDRNGDISMLSIKAMTNAAAECGSLAEGATCYEFANGTKDCLFGGEEGSTCKSS